MKNWQWYHLLYMILGWEVWRMYCMFRLLPKHNKVIGNSSPFGRWLTGMRYMFAAERIVLDAYNQSEGKPWAIPTRDKYHMCIPTKTYIEEYSSAPTRDIFLQSAVHELLPPHELYGGMPVGDTIGNLGLSQSIFKSSLRAYLPALQPLICQRIKIAFQVDIESPKLLGGWIKMPLHSTTYKMTLRLNSLIVVGEKLSDDPKFSKNLIRYLQNATIMEEVFRIVPSFCKTLLGKPLMKLDGSMNVVLEGIRHELQDRMGCDKGAKAKPMDCMQWSIDHSRKATLNGLTHHIIAMLFASTHQLPVLISFAFYRLCLHPEYIEPLRAEIMHYAAENHSILNEDRPLMDSFLREVARFHPITVVSMSHSVVHPFTFKDGTHVPKGNWVCIPQQAIMGDPSLYSDPSQFQGFRFANVEDQGDPTSKVRFSHPGWMFPYWGTIKQACPARFYVSMVAKMMLEHFIMNYDFKMPENACPSTFRWGIASVPHPRLSILVRERVSIEGS